MITAAPPLSSSAVAAPTRAEVALAPQRFERAKLGFDGLADVKPELVAWDVGGVFYQGRRLATGDEVVKIVVRAHGDEALAGFERDHARDTLSARSPLQICGRSAELCRATRAEEHIACVMVAPQGRITRRISRPPRLRRSLFEHDHLGVVMTIEVAAAEPAAYRPLIDRIIASIRCL